MSPVRGGEGRPTAPLPVLVGRLSSGQARFRTICALGLLVAASSVPIALADLRREVEANDTAATAQPLLAPASVGGHIGFPGDRDWYAVRIRPGGTVQASVLARGFRADTAPGSPLTARLSIVSGDGVSLLAQDDSQGGFDDPAVTVPVLQGGVFYVEVEDLNGLGGPDYQYVLSVEEEGNGDFAGATRLDPPVLPSIDTLIWPAGDHDVYRFDAAAGQVATIDMDSAVWNPNAPPVKGVLTLYAPDRTVLASDAYSAADPNDPFLSVTLPQSGTYYVDVHDLRGFVGTPTSVYQLSVELGPASSNDAPSGAEPVELARGLSGTLCPAGDRDEARPLPVLASTVSADLDAREDLQSLLTGSVSILDGSGAPLASSASSPDPLAIATAPASGAIVAVAGASGGLCEDAYWQLWIDADLDSDGLRLPGDDCPFAFDPGQEDRDRDGVGDACDVCVAVFNPAQETPLRVQEPVADTLLLSGGASGAVLSWTPAPGSIASNVYRVAATAAGTRPSFSCRADNVPGASWADSDPPAAGSVFFYLVTGENCGESGAGSDSTGRPEVFTNCPAPI